jgi:hypothetical protein
MEKLEKDGMVAVVISPGFGAGWSTWCHHDGSDEYLTMNKGIAQAVLDKNIPEVCRLAKEKFPDIYIGGAKKLEVEWVKKGTAFRITEYDGYEAVEIIGEIDHMTA